MIIAIVVIMIIAVLVGAFEFRRRSVPASRFDAAQRLRYLALGLGALGGVTAALALLNEHESRPLLVGALLPTVVAALPAVVGLVARSLAATLTTAADSVVMLMFVYLAGMSVGLLFVPAVLALFAACVMSIGQTREEAGGRSAG